MLGSAGDRSMARGTSRSKADSITAWFPEAGKHSGCYGVGVAIAIAESTGERPRVRIHRQSSFSTKAGGRNRERLLESVPDTDLARFLAAFGQRRRLQISRAILAGANTHIQLAKASGLAAGPLYHHIRALERAGILVVVERNRYDLTAFGRDLLLATTVLVASMKPAMS